MKKLALAIALLTVSLNLPANAGDSIKTINDASFNSEVAASAVPVVVDFYADWCGPCRRMGPIFDKIARQYGSRAKFVRVNIDNSPQTAQRMGIKSIPAFGVFKGGRLVDGVVGAVPESQLSAVIARGTK